MAKINGYKLIINPEKQLKNRALGVIPTAKEAISGTVKMAWPTVVDSFLSAVVSFVDMAMVSTISTSAITQVGLTTQPRFILLAVFMALSVAVTAVIARRFGEGDRGSANDCLHQMLSISFVIAIVLSVLGYLFAREFLLFAGAKDDTIDGSTTYFKMLMLGFVFNAVTICINAAQRGVGNTRISLKTNLTANIVNIIFNYLLINGKFGFPKLGVKGAAIATALGMFVSFVVAILSLVKKDGYLKLQIKKLFHFTKNTMNALHKVWWSAAVEQVFLRFGFFVFALIVAELGTNEFAIHQVGMNVMTLSFAFGDGFSSGAAALVGQNLGKKRSDLAEIYATTSRRLGFCLSAVLFVIFATCGEPIIKIFIKEPVLVSQGKIIMYFAALITTFQATQVIYNGALRGAGDVKFVAISMLISVAIIRPASAYIFAFVFNWGLIGVWCSFLLDQLIRFFMSMGRFKTGKWKNVVV